MLIGPRNVGGLRKCSVLSWKITQYQKWCERLSSNPYSKAARLRDGLEETCKLEFQTSRRTRAPLRDPWMIICGICASSVQLSHHLRESPVRRPVRRYSIPNAYTMYWLAGVHFDDRISQFLAFLDRVEDHDSSVRKSFEGYCCFESIKRNARTMRQDILKFQRVGGDVY